MNKEEVFDLGEMVGKLPHPLAQKIMFGQKTFKLLEDKLTMQQMMDYCMVQVMYFEELSRGEDEANIFLLMGSEDYKQVFSQVTEITKLYMHILMKFAETDFESKETVTQVFKRRGLVWGKKFTAESSNQ